MHIRTQIADQILACCLLAATSAFGSAQASAPAKPAVGTVMAPSAEYGKLLSLLEKEFVSAAEAMPEDKYDFSPPAGAGDFKGVRSFGDQVKHVAQANGYFFHDPNKPMVDDAASFDKLKTKAEIVKALKDSFAHAHAYVDAITPENAFVMTANGTRGEMAAFGMAHLMDHYGQMAVYLRMNNIIPPASRKGM
jgi:hypothetical protein